MAAAGGGAVQPPPEADDHPEEGEVPPPQLPQEPAEPGGAVEPLTAEAAEEQVRVWSADEALRDHVSQTEPIRAWRTWLQGQSPLWRRAILGG